MGRDGLPQQLRSGTWHATSQNSRDITLLLAEVALAPLPAYGNPQVPKYGTLLASVAAARGKEVKWGMGQVKDSGKGKDGGCKRRLAGMRKWSHGKMEKVQPNYVNSNFEGIEKVFGLSYIRINVIFEISLFYCTFTPSASVSSSFIFRQFYLCSCRLFASFYFLCCTGSLIFCCFFTLPLPFLQKEMNFWARSCLSREKNKHGLLTCLAFLLSL